MKKFKTYCGMTKLISFDFITITLFFALVSNSVHGADARLLNQLSGNRSGIMKYGCSGFDGVWKTTYGNLNITVTGNRASGTYTYNSIASTISGYISGNVLSGEYSQPGYPDKNYEHGKIEFKLTNTGWSGKWWSAGKSADNEAAGSWNGTCTDSR